MAEVRKTIKIIAMDVDGTLTDGRIYVGGSGETMKAFSVKDGLGIEKAKGRGLIPVVITGRCSDIVARRMFELGVGEVYQGVRDKTEVLRQVADRYGSGVDSAAFIGDDENDMDAIRICGLSACPADAAASVKNVVDYVCKTDGGKGAVREFIEYIIAMSGGTR
jgi:3-deoxy-D-manno-octulosonate 8-phosphate phosphatase (KDO 8-P phosphatase)